MREWGARNRSLGPGQFGDDRWCTAQRRRWRSRLLARVPNVRLGDVNSLDASDRSEKAPHRESFLRSM